MAEPANRRELRDLLCEWDPIGVFADDPYWPRDEYDTLIGPLLGRLQKGENPEQVRGYLTDELKDYYGIDAPSTTPDFAGRIFAWYADFQERPPADDRRL